MSELAPIILILQFLFEIILLLSWSRIYFRTGIPVFMKRFPFFGSLEEPFDARFLEENFTGMYMPPFFFRQISSKECAFREKLWNFRLFSYIPVMRGLIKGDEDTKAVYVIGYLNWYVALLVAFAAFSGIFSSSPSWAPMFILVLLFYFIQVSRFKNIADVAFEWLKKNR